MTRYSSDSELDAIMAEMDQEKRFRHKSSMRYKLGCHLAHCMKVKQIVANIERNLKKDAPYPLDRLRRFIENYEKYPEVRPYAEKVLSKIIYGETVTQSRLNAYNNFRRKIKEFQRQ